MSTLRRAALALPIALALLQGCASVSNFTPSGQNPTLSGHVHGGQQPVAGASIQLYTAGLTADGSAATPLLSTPAISDSNGNFTITTPYTCPTGQYAYIVGTGGSPATFVSNPQLAMMTALGPCTGLSSSTSITINEVTTVAAVYALVPYMTSLTSVGSSPSDAAALAAAFTRAQTYASSSTGTAPGSIAPPTGFAVPTPQINTLANILATCINSPGGVFGDTSSCGKFFALTYPGVGPAPTEALGALRNLANNPTYNTASLYPMATPASPFQPSDTAQPTDFRVSLLSSVPGIFSRSPSQFVFSATNLGASVQTSVTLTNAGVYPIPITSIGLASGAPASLSESHNCPASLPAGQSCVITVSFAPTTYGSANSNVTVQYTSYAAQNYLAIPIVATSTIPSLVFSPSSVTIAPVVAGSTGTSQAVTLTNSGNATANLGAMSFFGANPSLFAQTNNCLATLAPSASCTFTFTDAPSQPGPLSASFMVASSPSSPVLTLSGSGTTSPLLSSDSQFYVPTGGSATFKLFNGGSSAISLTSISPSTGFSQSNTCGTSLAAAATCTVTITAAAGIDVVQGLVVVATGTVTILSNASNTSLAVSLYSIDPAQVQNMGSALVGSTSTTTGEIGCSNFGAYCTASTAAMGPNASDFPGSSGFYTVHGPYGDGVDFTFTPTAVGSRLNVLLDNAASSSQTYYLLVGYGLHNVITPTPSSVAFGDAAIGATASQTISVTNPYGHLLNISSSGAGFSVSPSTCSTTTCTLVATYSPTAWTTRAQNGAITVADTADWQVAPVTIALSGWGGRPVLNFTPASPLNFGYVASGTTTAAQSFTVSNTGDAPSSGNASVTYSAPSVSDFGTPSGTYTFSGATPLNSPSYAFSPAALGSRNGTITFTDPRNNSVITTFLLTGNGLPASGASVGLSPSSLAYVNPGTIKSITVTNYGPTAVTISGYSFTGLAASQDFTQTAGGTTCGTTLAAGTSCVVAVTSGLYSRSATFTIADGNPAATQTVALSAKYVNIYNFGTASRGNNAIWIYSGTSTTTNYHSAGIDYSPPPFSTNNQNTCQETGTAGCSIALYFAPTAFYPTVTPGQYFYTGQTYTDSGSSTITFYGTYITSGPGVSFTSTAYGAAYGFITAHTATANTITIPFENTGFVTVGVPGISSFVSLDSTAVPTSTTCPTTLAVNAACTVTFTYTRPAAGYDSFHVVYTDSISGQTFDTFVLTKVVSP